MSLTKNLQLPTKNFFFRVRSKRLDESSKVLNSSPAQSAKELWRR